MKWTTRKGWQEVIEKILEAYQNRLVCFIRILDFTNFPANTGLGYGG